MVDSRSGVFRMVPWELLICKLRNDQENHAERFCFLVMLGNCLAELGEMVLIKDVRNSSQDPIKTNKVNFTLLSALQVKIKPTS